MWNMRLSLELLTLNSRDENGAPICKDYVAGAGLVEEVDGGIEESVVGVLRLHRGDGFARRSAGGVKPAGEFIVGHVGVPFER